jgi:tRNA pseudouridine55 synthase
MKSGFVLIDKTAGVSSARVVAQVKKKLGARKVGHAGTLDPDATGLLIVLVNGATKIASFASGGMKVYSGTMRLGVRTSTDDMSGEVLEQNESIPEWSQIKQCISTFQGSIQQVPPNVSAVKVDGKRAYARHRKGESFDLGARTVQIADFECAPTPSQSSFFYRVTCSPGTYVRSLARDIGDALGCGGAVESIHRESSGEVSVRDAIAVEDVRWEDVQEWGQLLPHFKRIEVSESESEELLQGKESILSQIWDHAIQRHTLSLGEYIVFSEHKSARSLGILQVIEGERFSFFKNVGR